MKRILWIFTVIAMLLTLAACGGTAPEEEAALDQVVETPDNAGQGQETPDQPENTTPENKEPVNTTPENTVPENKEPENTTPENKEPENATPEDTTPEDTTPQEPDEEIVFEDDGEEEPSYEGWIKVASYNTKALMYSADKEGIVQELKDIDADIVGIQEIDSFTSRSGQYDQMEYLAKECGYPYWSFDKLIDHSGGAYGMGILSRYPIKESSVVQYQAQQSTDHVRKYGRHVLDVDGKEVVFYNTHLCVGDDADSVSTLQLKELCAEMNKDQYAILTGDFNMKAPTAAGVIKEFSKLKILNDGDKNTTAYIGNSLAANYIDNIMTTKTFDTMLDDWSGTGIKVSQTKYSDHNLVYTYVNFK